MRCKVLKAVSLGRDANGSKWQFLEFAERGTSVNWFNNVERRPHAKRSTLKNVLVNSMISAAEMCQFPVCTSTYIAAVPSSLPTKPMFTFATLSTGSCSYSVSWAWINYRLNYDIAGLASDLPLKFTINKASEEIKPKLIQANTGSNANPLCGWRCDWRHSGTLCTM